MYLNFVEVSDLLKHLRDRNLTQLHAEISNRAGSPSEKFQISTISYYAALSARVGDHRFGGYIATSSRELIRTTSVDISIPQECDRVRQTMFQRFDEICDELREQGFEVERGLWSTVPPFFVQS